MASNSSQERVPHAPWSVKEVDGLLYIKVNGQRVFTKSKHLVEEVFSVSAHKNGKDISITMKNTLAVNGKTTLIFDISDFEDTNGPLSSPNRKAQEFESSWKRWKTFKEKAINLSSEPRTPQLRDSSDSEGESEVITPVLTQTSKKSSKRRTTEEEELDLQSPGKKIKRATTLDQEITTHHIGMFRLEVERLKDPPQKWLDRSLNEEHVDNLAKSIKEDPFSFTHDQQPWVAIADISRDDVLKNKNLIKGCNVTVIGGLHRKAAFSKVCSTSENHREALTHVFVSLYGNTITDEQVKRVAANHNINNKASMTTTWVERVETCRNWRYQMEGLPTNGPTPPSTTEWRDSCKRMFVESGKSQHTLEPTLQAALMEKPAWDLFQMTVKKFAKGELKDQQTQQTRKRIRKKQELTQNQLGMPLQGISLDSKVRLLRAVVAGELSLKEMMAKTARIKAKKTIIDAFMKHTGTDSWEELKSLYPEHTKEEQISQFSHLKFRKSNVPQELKDFFQRAVSLRERQREGRRKSESVVEMDGVHVFANGDAIAAKGTVDSPGIVEVKSACPEITGFELVVARVPKGLTPEDLKLFLINIHSLNIERMDHYNVVLLIEDTTDQQLLENVLKSKMISDGFQRLYWNNTKRLPLKGRKIANRLQAIIVGHWTDSGSLIPGSCHFDINELTTNVLSHDGEVEGEYPQPLLECLLRHFSYPEAWVYGLNITPGPFVRACVELSRKCVSISEDPRRDSRLIQKAFLCKRNDNFEEDEESVKESEEDEDEETLDQETANSQIMY